MRIPRDCTTVSSREATKQAALEPDHLVKLDKFFSGHLQLPDSERRGRGVEEAVFSRDRGETSLQRAGKSPKSHILLHTICNSNSFVLMGLFVTDQLVGRLLQ